MTSEGYEEYHSVANQIGEMLPDMVAGFDSQGNAILKCRDNINELVDAYNKLLSANFNDQRRQRIPFAEDEEPGAIDSASGSSVCRNAGGSDFAAFGVGDGVALIGRLRLLF